MGDDPRGMNNQPLPKHNDSPSMHDLVCRDLEARKEYGLRKYKTVLQAHNGRDPLQDAYDEVLDLAVYLKQSMIERDVHKQQLLRLQDLLDDGLIDTARALLMDIRGT